jgi:DMSO/TMAO reductase YedYZ molybdopterin-dependent catalytic subunit
MDSAVWTGVPIIDLIEDADPNGDYVMLRADDGFYEEFSVDALRDGFLAYDMNNQNLSTSHGYPVRALIPGHWGEINVK